MPNDNSLSHFWVKVDNMPRFQAYLRALRETGLGVEIAAANRRISTMMEVKFKGAVPSGGKGGGGHEAKIGGRLAASIHAHPEPLKAVCVVGENLQGTGR